MLVSGVYVVGNVVFFRKKNVLSYPTDVESEIQYLSFVGEDII